MNPEEFTFSVHVLIFCVTLLVGLSAMALYEKWSDWRHRRWIQKFYAQYKGRDLYALREATSLDRYIEKIGERRDED